MPRFCAWNGKRPLTFTFYLCLSERRHVQIFVCEFAVFQVGEVIVVADFQFPVSHLYLYRAPHLFNGIERALLLHVRTYDAVGSEVAHAVYNTILVSTHNALVHEIPEEASGTTRIRHHQFPIVFQPGAVSAIVEAVQELCWHEDFLLAHKLSRLAPRTVVLRLEAVAVGPGIEHYALLRVILRKHLFQLVVEAALIAVAPEDYRWVIHVSCHHLLHYLRADNRFMCPMPSWLFTLHIESERVAGVEELRVCGVMRQAHSIHVHRLDKLHVLNVLLP